MKTILQLFLILALLFGSGIIPSSAMASPALEEDELTFSELGLETDIILHGPYDTRNLRFDLPATWQLQPGAELAIQVKVAVTVDASVTSSSYSGAMLEVFVNDQFQQSIPLSSNENTTYYVPIAPEDLVSPNPGGWHELSFSLFAEWDCTLDFHKTTVTISSDSVAYLPHELRPLSVDLRRLPWPIYLQHAKALDPVTLVIPAAPSADELQAALVTMGSFGRMTDGLLPVSMITADKVTQDLLGTSHIILVGKPSGFSVLGDLSFAVPLANGQLSSSRLQEDDGVVQMLPSPWNSARAILMISGNTDAAVVKAAQALSTLNLQTGDTPDYSIISQVFPAPLVGTSDTELISPQPADLKLTDLGFGSVTVTGLGLNWIDYEFTIPLGMIAGESPYLDLSLSVSSLVDPTRSEGIIYLNDVQIGSIPLASEASNLINARIELPRTILRSGNNNLSVVLNLLPYDACLTVLALPDLWATVYGDSVIHLPLVQAPASTFALQDLKGYPYPFGVDPALNTTAFVVSKQDPASWLQAARVAYDLGARVAGPVMGFETAYDGELAEDLKKMNLILVGEPRNLGILSDLKDAMPASFDGGSNIAVLESQQVVYRISDKKSLGYIELFPSPWSDQRAVMGLFGTTPTGLSSALDAILDFRMRDTFSGDFVTMDGNHAHIIDTRTGTGMGNIIVSLNPSVTPKGTDEPGSNGLSSAELTFARSRQLILVGAIIVMGLIVVTTAAALWLRRKRQ